MSKSFGLVGLVALLLISTTHASSLLPQTLEEEIRAAEFICPIQILESESRLKGDRVETLYRVRKDRDCFKGQISSPSFYILSPGGSYSLNTPQGKQRLTTMVPGAPQFKVKERQLVYLQSTEEADVFRLHSWTHHEYQEDGRTLQRKAEPNTLGRSARPQQVEAGPQSLDEFEKLVSRVLRQNLE